MLPTSTLSPLDLKRTDSGLAISDSMNRQPSSGRTPGTRSRVNSDLIADTSVGLREIAKKLGKAILQWESPPQTVLIVSKPQDLDLVGITKDVAEWLIESMNMTVFVEDRLKDEPLFGWTESNNYSFKLDEVNTTYTAANSSSLPHEISPTGSFIDYNIVRSDSGYDSNADIKMEHIERQKFSSSTCDSLRGCLQSKLQFWSVNEDFESKYANGIDLLVTLGGDGTVLFTAGLFSKCSRCPPILPFDLGSLGFLASFKFDNAKDTLTKVLKSETSNESPVMLLNPPAQRNIGFAVNMRMRLACTVYRRDEVTGEAFPTETIQVLNELLVDRGPSPYMSQLELMLDDSHLTTLQADGLVIATPTGSTAYSLSANGSMVHPLVPTILVTPICPHTLSFRPMLLPDSVELKVVMPLSSRTASAWAAFDGRNRVELKRGDYISIVMSTSPVPTICFEDQSRDWIQSLKRCLNWNVRAPQKSFS